MAIQKSNPITISQLFWDSANLQAVILKNILEDGYGFSVNLIGGEPGSSYSAITNGTIDISPELWTGPTTDNANVLNVGTGMGGSEGFYIDKFSAEKYDISSIADMLKPEIASLFSHGGTSSALIDGPEAWKTETEILHYSMGLDTTYDIVHATGTDDSALKSIITTHLENNTPVFTYLWEPHALVSELVRIDPGTDSATWGNLEGVSINDPISTLKALGVEGWYTPLVTTAVNKDFSEQNSVVTTFLESYDISSATLSDLLAHMKDNYLSFEQTAHRYLTTNDEWQAWVEADQINLILDSIPDGITIANPNWSSPQNQTAILSAILEEGYGYSVNLVPGDNVSTFTALTEGSIDIAPEVWVSEITANENALYLGDGLLGAGLGLFIDKYTADLYGIDSIDDMFDPAISQLFIEDGNPTFHLPPENWGDISEKLFYSMGLDSIYSLSRSFTQAEGNIQNYLDNNTPVFTFYFEPSGVSKYMFRIDPGSDISQLDVLNSASVDDPIDDLHNLGVDGYPNGLVTVAVNKTFSEQNSEVTTFLENYDISSATLSELIDYSRTHSWEETAQYYLTTNNEWQAWVTNAVSDNLETYTSEVVTYQLSHNNNGLYIKGTTNDDIIAGSSNGDTIIGSLGSDIISGGGKGSSGKWWRDFDTVEYSQSIDVYNRNTGENIKAFDVLINSDNSVSVTRIDLTGAGANSTDTLWDIGRITFGENENWTEIFLDQRQDVWMWEDWQGDPKRAISIEGGIGNDLIQGTDQQDWLKGGDGNDIILADKNVNPISAIIAAGGNHESRSLPNISEGESSAFTVELGEILQAAFIGTNSDDQVTTQNLNVDLSTPSTIQFIVTGVNSAAATSALAASANVDDFVGLVGVYRSADLKVDIWVNHNLTLNIDGTDTPLQGAVLLDVFDSQNFVSGDRIEGGEGNDFIDGGLSGNNTEKPWENNNEVRYQGKSEDYQLKQISVSGTEGSETTFVDGTLISSWWASEKPNSTDSPTNFVELLSVLGLQNVTIKQDLYVLVNDQKGDDGIDILANVQRIQFNDNNIFLEPEVRSIDWRGESEPSGTQYDGTLFSDQITGTDGYDDINGKGGNDLLLAGSGADHINSGSGNDFVDGGASGNHYNNRWQDSDTVRFDGSIKRYSINKIEQTEVQAFWDANFSTDVAASLTYNPNQSYFLVTDQSPVFSNGATLLTNVDKIEFEGDTVWLNTSVEQSEISWLDPYSGSQVRVEGTQFNDTIIAADIMSSQVAKDFWNIEFNGHSGDDVFIGDDMGSSIRDGAGNDLIVGAGSPILENDRWFGQDQVHFSGVKARYQIELIGGGDVVIDSENNTTFDLTKLTDGEITTADGTVHQVGSGYNKAYVVKDLLPAEFEGQGINLLLGVERINFSDTGINLESEVYENTWADPSDPSYVREIHVRGTTFGDIINTEENSEHVDLNNWVDSDEGNDYISTGGGADYINPGKGNDFIDGGLSGSGFDRVRFDTSKDSFVITQASQAQVEAFWGDNFATQSFTYQVAEDYYFVTDTNPVDGFGVNLITNIDRVEFNDDNVQLNHRVSGDHWDNPSKDNFRVEGTQFNDVIYSTQIIVDRSVLPELYQTESGAAIRVEMDGRAGNDVFIGGSEENQFTGAAGNDLFVGDTSNSALNANDEVRFTSKYIRYQIDTVNSGDIVYEIKGDSSSGVVYDLTDLVNGNITTEDGSIYSVGNHHLSGYVVRDMLSNEQGGHGIDVLLGVEQMSFTDKYPRLTPEIYENDNESTLLANGQLTEFDDFLDLRLGITTNQGNEVHGGQIDGKEGDDTVIGFSLGTHFKGGIGNDIFIAPNGYVASNGDWWESNQASYSGPSTRYQIETGYLEIGADNLPVYTLGLEDVVPPIREINWSDSYVVGYQSAFRVTDQLTDALGGDGTDYLVGLQSLYFEGDDSYFRVGTTNEMYLWNYFIENDAFLDEYGNSDVFGNKLANAKLVYQQEGSRFDDTLIGAPPSLPSVGSNQEISLDLSLLSGLVSTSDVAMFKDLQGQQVAEAVRPFESLPVGTALTAKLWVSDADATAINTTLSQEGVSAADLLTTLALSSDRVKLIITTTDENSDLDNLFAYFSFNNEGGSFQQIVDQGATYLRGHQGNDILIGTVGPDYFKGGMGDDTIIGGGANTYDVAQFDGARDQYTIDSTWVLLDSNYRLIGESNTQVNSNYLAATKVTDTNTGADGDGSDIVIGVERIEFDGGSINVLPQHSFNLADSYPGVNLNDDEMVDFPSFYIETADIGEVLDISSITSQYSYSPYVSTTPFGNLTTDSFRKVEASEGDDVFFGLANNSVWSTESTGDDIFYINGVDLNQLSFSQGYDTALTKNYVEVVHTPNFEGDTDYGTNRLYDFDQIEFSAAGSRDSVNLPLALNPSLEWFSYGFPLASIEDSLFDDVIDDSLITDFVFPEGLNDISITMRGGNDTINISEGSIWVNSEYVDKWRINDGDDFVNTGDGLDIYQLSPNLSEFKLTYFYDANGNKQFDVGEGISLTDFQTNGVIIYDGANPYKIEGNTSIDYATYLADHSGKTLFGDDTTWHLERDTGWFTYNDNYFIEISHEVPNELYGQGTDVVQNVEFLVKSGNQTNSTDSVVDLLTGSYYGSGYITSYPADYSFDVDNLSVNDIAGDLTRLRTTIESSNTNVVSFTDSIIKPSFHFDPANMTHWAIDLTYDVNDQQHSTITGLDGVLTLSLGDPLYSKIGDIITTALGELGDNASLQLQATNFSNSDDITFYTRENVTLGQGNDIIDLAGESAQDEKGAGWLQDNLDLGAPFSRFNISYDSLDGLGKIPNAEFNFLDYVGEANAPFARVSDKLAADLGGLGINYLFDVDWISPDGTDWTVGELSTWYVDWSGVDRLHIDGTGANEVIAPLTIDTAIAAINSNSVVGVITDPGKGDDVLIGLQQDKFSGDFHKLDIVEIAPSAGSFDAQRVYIGLADDYSDVARGLDGSITYYDFGETVAANYQLEEAVLLTDQIADIDGGYGTKLIIDFETIMFAEWETDYALSSEYKIETWDSGKALSVKGTKFDDTLIIGQSDFDVLNANNGNQVSIQDKAGNDSIVILSKEHNVNVRIGAGNDYAYLGDHLGDLGENNWYNINLYSATQARFDVQTVGVVLNESYLPSVDSQGNWVLTDASTVGALEAVLVTDVLKTGIDYGSNLLVGFNRIQFSTGEIRMEIEEYSSSWTDSNSGIEYFDVTQRGTALGELISFKVGEDGNPVNVQNRLEGKGGDDVLIGSGVTGDRLSGGAGDDVLIGSGNGNTGHDWRDLDEASYDVSSLDRLAISSVKVGYNATTNALWRDTEGAIQLNPASDQLSTDFSLTAAYQVSDVVSDELGGFGSDILIGIERIGITGSSVDLGVTTQLHDWNQDGVIDRAEVRGSQFNDIIRSTIDGGDIDDVTFLDRNNDINTKAGDDDIFSGAGGDWIRAGTGNDFVDGGSNEGKNNWGGDNQDEVRFSSNQSAYEISSTIFAGAAHDIKDLDEIIVFTIQADGQVMRVSSEGNLSFLSQLTTNDRYTIVQDQTPSGDLDGEGTNLLIGVEAISFQDNYLRLAQNEGKHLDANGDIQHAWLEGTALGDTLIGHDYNEDIRGYSGNDVLFGGGGGDRLQGGAGNDILIGGSNGNTGDEWRDLDQADYWQYNSDRADITSIQVGLSVDGKSLLLDESREVLLNPTVSQLGEGYTLIGAYQVQDKVEADYGGFGSDTLVGVERIGFKEQTINLLITTYEDDWNQDGVIDWSEIRGTEMNDRVTTIANDGAIEDTRLLNADNFIRTEGGDDDIWAMAGGDNIRPGSGNDYINGGANGMNNGSGYIRKDSVEFSGTESRYEINSFSFIGEAVDINDLAGNTVFKILTDGSLLRVNSDNSYSSLDQLSSNQKVTQVTDLMPGGVLGGEGVNLMINVESLNFNGSWMGLEVERNLQYDSQGNLVNSWINGTSSGDTGLTGTLINDSINGNAGDDVLVGLQGSDHFNGGAGNDVIWGDFQNSSVVLPGEDVVRFNGLQAQYSYSQIDITTDDVVISAIQVTDLLSADLGGTGTDTLYGIEALSFSDSWLRVGVEMYEHKDGDGVIVERSFNGSIFDDHIIGSNVSDNIQGKDGNDVMIGDAGGDYFEGGEGSDTIYGGAEGVDAWGNARVDVARFSGKWDEYSIDHYDSVGVKALSNDPEGHLTVQVKSDDGTGDIDTLYGIERLEFSDRQVSFSAAQNFTDANGDGVPDWAEIRGTTEADTLNGTDIDDILYGDDGDDTLTGNNGNDTLSGDGGSDALDGGSGSDVFGNAFIDTAIYSGDYKDYVVSGSGNSWTVTKGAEIDTLTNIEVLAFDDMSHNLVAQISTRDFDKNGTTDFANLSGTLTGDTFNVVDDKWTLSDNSGSIDYYLDLGAGNDSATLGSGDDVIVEYLGEDTYDGGAGFDTLQLAGNRTSWGEIVTNGDGSRTIMDSDGNNSKTISNVEQIQFTDEIVVLISTTIGLDKDLDGTVDSMLYTGTELQDNITATSSLQWTINTGASVDALYGNDGDDRLNGGLGSDILSGGGGEDTAVYDSLVAGSVITEINLSESESGEITESISGLLSGFKVKIGDDEDLLLDVEVIEFSDGLVNLNSSEKLLSSFSLSNGLENARYVEGTQFSDTLTSSSYEDTLTGGNGADSFVIKEGGYNTVTIEDFVGLSDTVNSNDILQFDSTDDATLFGISVASWFSANSDILAANVLLADADDTNDTSAQTSIDDANATKLDVVSNILKTATFDTNRGDATFNFTGDNYLYLSNISEDDLSVVNIDIV